MSSRFINEMVMRLEVTNESESKSCLQYALVLIEMIYFVYSDSETISHSVEGFLYLVTGVLTANFFIT